MLKALHHAYFSENRKVFKISIAEEYFNYSVGAIHQLVGSDSSDLSFNMLSITHTHTHYENSKHTENLEKYLNTHNIDSTTVKILHICFNCVSLCI